MLNDHFNCVIIAVYI